MTKTTTASTTNLFLLEVGGELFEERGHVEKLSAIQTKNNDQAIGSQKIGVLVFVDFLELCRSKFRNFFALAGTILSFSGTTKSRNKKKSSELRLIELFKVKCYLGDRFWHVFLLELLGKST